MAAILDPKLFQSSMTPEQYAAFVAALPQNAPTFGSTPTTTTPPKGPEPRPMEPPKATATTWNPLTQGVFGASSGGPKLISVPSSTTGSAINSSYTGIQPTDMKATVATASAAAANATRPPTTYEQSIADFFAGWGTATAAQNVALNEKTQAALATKEGTILINGSGKTVVGSGGSSGGSSGSDSSSSDASLLEGMDTTTLLLLAGGALVLIKVLQK